MMESPVAASACPLPLKPEPPSSGLRRRATGKRNLGFGSRLPALVPLLLTLFLFMGGGDAIRLWKVSLNPVRWIRGDTPFLKSKIKSLEDELRQIHTHHAMLMDEVRQMRAKRAKELAELRQMSLSQSKELKKVVENMKKASALEMELVKKKMNKGFEEERRQWKETAEKEKAKAVEEVETQEREAAALALEDREVEHKEQLTRLREKHEEELERVRQEQQDLDGAAYTEEELEQEVAKAVGEVKKAAREEIDAIKADYEKQLEEQDRKLEVAREREKKLQDKALVEQEAIRRKYEEQIEMLTVELQKSRKVKATSSSKPPREGATPGSRQPKKKKPQVLGRSSKAFRPE